MSIKKLFLFGFASLLLNCQLCAASSPPAISIARGFSGVNNMSGFFISWATLLE